MEIIFRESCNIFFYSQEDLCYTDKDVHGLGGEMALYYCEVP